MTQGQGHGGQVEYQRVLVVLWPLKHSRKKYAKWHWKPVSAHPLSRITFAPGSRNGDSRCVCKPTSRAGRLPVLISALVPHSVPGSLDKPGKRLKDKGLAPKVQIQQGPLFTPPPGVPQPSPTPNILPLDARIP